MSNLLVQNIKHTNGTTAQTIDSTGRVLTPARPSFRAKPSGSATTIGNNNDIVFGDVTSATHGCHNIGGHYSTSTGNLLLHYLVCMLFSLLVIAIMLMTLKLTYFLEVKQYQLQEKGLMVVLMTL